MAGLVLWAFFLLGVMTGFSGPGRRLVTRASLLVQSWSARALGDLGPLAGYFGQSVLPARFFGHPGDRIRPPVAEERAAGGFLPVALVERPEGFYALSAERELSGPVSPATQPDVPILSGPAVENASPETLVGYAAILVRAEAELSSLISEMHVPGDGTAALYLDRKRIEIVIDLGREGIEMRRATEVLQRWRGREALIAMIDMTTPGLAVLRLKTDVTRLARGAAGLRPRGIAGRAPLRRIAEADRRRGPVMR